MASTANNTSAKINKSLVMKAAWELFRKNKVASLAEALHKAWKAYKLKAKMTGSVVKFIFRKTNGEIRNAVGTLAKNLFQYETKGARYALPAGTIRYWDLEKQAFRSFCVDSLL